MQKTIQDLRYGLRLLIKSPFFTLTAILSLGLGIGACTSSFSAMNELIFSALPAAVKDPDRLFRINAQLKMKNSQGSLMCSYEDYLFYKDQNPVFSDLLAYSSEDHIRVYFGGAAAEVKGSYVSGNFFSLLGISAHRGRLIMPDDDRQENGRQVAVISYPFWRSFFNSDPSIAGREIRVNRTIFTIIGVAPKDFGNISAGFAAKPPSIYMPATLRPKESNRRGGAFHLIGQLLPDVNPAQATVVMQARFKQRQVTPWDLHIVIFPASKFDSGTQRMLLTIFGFFVLMTAIILWIPCANVSSLLLARAMERRKEIALRAALGASRRRLMRQLLTESLFLGALAGAAGPLIATWIIHIIAGNWNPDSLLFGAELNLNKNVLAFTIALSALTSIAFGLIPALHAMRADLTSALRDQEKIFFRTFRLMGTRNLLVVLNIAGSLAVLIIAGLIVQQVEKKSRAELPLNPDTLLQVPLRLNPEDYTAEHAREFRLNLQARLQSIPQIHCASLASADPQQTMSAPNHESERASIALIGRDYFRSINYQFARGREFFASEFQSNGDAVIVNEALAQRYWPGQDALGQQLIRHSAILMDAESFTVVGVVKDSLLNEDGSFSGSPKPLAYLPISESYNQEMMLRIRTIGEAKALKSSIRHIISDLDPGLLVSQISTLAEQIEKEKKEDRYGVAMLIALAMLALGLASMGLFAVVTYSVSRRTQEIGIRVALGAERSTVLRQLIREGLQLTAIGLIIGLFVAFAIARYLESTGIPIESSSPLMYLAACLLLIPIAALACFIPARKAIRINPMTALKYE